MRPRRRRRRFAIAIGLVIALVALVGLFDLSMLWQADRETELAPDTGAGWVLAPQVHEPADGAVTRGSAILLHGFVGSPYDFQPLVGPLTEIGYRVVVPVLPEQSRKTPAWDRGEIGADGLVRWARDLIAEETALTGRPPVLVGFSMGGALAMLAAEVGGIERLVLLAPYLGLVAADGAATATAELAQWAIPIIPKTQRGQINDPEGYARYEPGSYMISMEGFLRLQRLAERARLAARHVTVPTLVVYAPEDSVVSAETLKRVIAEMPAAELVSADASDHVLLFDYDAEAVVEAVLAFLDRS